MIINDVSSKDSGFDSVLDSLRARAGSNTKAATGSSDAEPERLNITFDAKTDSLVSDGQRLSLSQAVQILALARAQSMTALTDQLVQGMDKQLSKMTEAKQIFDEMHESQEKAGSDSSSPMSPAVKQYLTDNGIQMSGDNKGDSQAVFSTDGKTFIASSMGGGVTIYAPSGSRKDFAGSFRDYYKQDKDDSSLWQRRDTVTLPYESFSMAKLIKDNPDQAEHMPKEIKVYTSVKYSKEQWQTNIDYMQSKVDAMTQDQQLSFVTMKNYVDKANDSFEAAASTQTEIAQSTSEILQHL